jgi:UDP-N-acetylglucosamine 2-epimerase (non-hydrolysing)
MGEPLRGGRRRGGAVARNHPDLLVVLPVHRDPVVRKALLPLLRGLPNVLVVEPLAYADFVRLIARSTLILTGSGGVQTQASSLGKPVLVHATTLSDPKPYRREGSHRRH